MFEDYFYNISRNTTGFSVFQVFRHDSLFDITGRCDYFDNNMNKDTKGVSVNYFLFRFCYRPVPVFSITPKLLAETYEDLINTQTYKTSVTARITFFYSYNE